LQVESLFPARFPFALLILCGGVLLAPVAGCRRSPAPDVMATVNGKEILRSDLERKYQDYKLSQGETPQEPSAEQEGILRLAVLRQMIDEEILQQRAAKLNVTASDEDVNDKLTETKLLNKEIESKINITEAEIASFYNSHKAEFNFIEPQYHLAQIVVTGAPAQQTGNLQNNKASGDADAKKKIQTLQNKLQNGEDFGAVAMNFSENANNAASGGDMGFVAESQLRAEPDAFNAIGKLKPGQISEILPVYDSAGPGRRTVGYAIYKLIGRESAGQRELNDPRVQQGIHQLLHEGHAQLLKNAYFEMLHNEAKIHNYLADQMLKEGAQ
jgi:peptidyl-prolyl cis-trans isomerase SurA